MIDLISSPHLVLEKHRSASLLSRACACVKGRRWCGLDRTCKYKSFAISTRFLWLDLLKISFLCLQKLLFISLYYCFRNQHAQRDKQDPIYSGFLFNHLHQQNPGPSRMFLQNQLIPPTSLPFKLDQAPSHQSAKFLQRRA